MFLPGPNTRARLKTDEGALMTDEAGIRKQLFRLAQSPIASGSEDTSIRVTEAELRELRQLPDIDLITILSEINDDGWEAAKRTLASQLIARDEQD